MSAGPPPNVAPVAPADHRPGRTISAGYDAMKWPATVVEVQIVANSGGTTYTRERPGHGRSGGALIDRDAGYLIGVVQGYEVGGRGMYVSLNTINHFLKRVAEPGGALDRAPRQQLPMPNCPT